MKIIHCGDIHLDSRMESNLPAAKARERNAEICATFVRMVAFAAEKGVQVVLMAGDLFDTDKVSTQTVDLVLDQISQYPDIDFLNLRGNHDASAFAGMELPQNLKIFGPEWTQHTYGNIVVSGIEPDRENWDRFYDSLVLPEDKINLVMLHGQTGTQSGEEVIALPKLRGKNIDYLALGHIHSNQTGKLDDRGIWCYCGCLEGRGFDECGEKGFVLLDVQANGIRTEFVPFARRTLHEVPVDITGLSTVTQILGAMEATVREISGSDLVKFTLTGSYTPETQKDLRFLQKMLEEKFYFVKIKDESRLVIGKESYEHDVSLKGEFIRLVMASGRSEEEKERIILWGIQALSGTEVEV